MAKQVTMYRDEKSGRFVSGKREPNLEKEVAEYLRDSAYADALVQEALGRILDEKNAEIWDDGLEPRPTGFDIINFLMDISVKASAIILFFVAAMYLGVRV